MISVIVPIYNVEQYLPRCLKSLEAQTLRDVEFLLIDDGSTDRSGQIADECKDPRFKVFHTENHGLSAARNYGIEQAQGGWFMFVDSDDWVSPDYCEAPLSEAVTSDADLVIFRAYSVRDGKVYNDRNSEFPPGIVDAERALDLGRNSVWNKLYRRELFDGIRFDNGRAAEDVAITYKLILAAHRIVFLDRYLYYYFKRENSLGRSRITNSYVDAFLFARERYETLVSAGHSPKKAEVLMVNKAASLITIPGLFGTEVYQQAEEVLERVKKTPKELPTGKKLALFVWRRNRKLFRTICKVLFRNRYKTRTKQENA